MKVLITGAKGMLGQYCSRVFSDLNAVIDYDKDAFDITKKEEVESVLYLKMPDLVINCAALNAVDLIETDNDTFNKAMEINCIAVRNLAQVTKKLDIPIVHFSSDYVFDGQNQEGYKEYEVPLGYVNKYGETKYCGEQELKTNTDKYYLIRLTRLFGEVGRGVDVKRSFVDVMLEMSKEKKAIQVVDDELANPTYALDLAFQTEYIVNNMPNGIYHVTNYGSCTWYGFAEEIFKLSNIDIQLNRVNSNAYLRPAARPKYSVLINTKLPPLRSWKDALKDYLKHSDII